MYTINLYTPILCFINHYSVFNAIQTQIMREKIHLEQIEQLKYKLCTKDHNINTLKQINDLNEEQIDEYQVCLFLYRTY